VPPTCHRCFIDWGFLTLRLRFFVVTKSYRKQTGAEEVCWAHHSVAYTTWLADGSCSLLHSRFSCHAITPCPFFLSVQISYAYLGSGCIETFSFQFLAPSNQSSCRPLALSETSYLAKSSLQNWLETQLWLDYTVFDTSCSECPSLTPLMREGSLASNRVRRPNIYHPALENWQPSRKELGMSFKVTWRVHTGTEWISKDCRGQAVQ
jgi:hypothetical protein